MALSNMGREPRREWTEQLFGILGLIIFLGIDYTAAFWFQTFTGGPVKGLFWAIGMMVIPFALSAFVIIGSMLWYGIHAMGEGVCAILSNRGLDPRPKNRR